MPGLGDPLPVGVIVTPELFFTLAIFLSIYKALQLKLVSVLELQTRTTASAGVAVVIIIQETANAASEMQAYGFLYDVARTEQLNLMNAASDAPLRNSTRRWLDGFGLRVMAVFLEKGSRQSTRRYP